jgi:hypothetical protein
MIFAIRLMVIQLGFSVSSVVHAHEGHGALPSNLFFHYFVDGRYLLLFTVLFTVLFAVFSFIRGRRWLRVDMI